MQKDPLAALARVHVVHKVDVHVVILGQATKVSKVDVLKKKKTCTTLSCHTS